MVNREASEEKQEEIGRMTEKKEMGGGERIEKQKSRKHESENN